MSVWKLSVLHVPIANSSILVCKHQNVFLQPIYGYETSNDQNGAFEWFMYYYRQKEVMQNHFCATVY
jgi:hypothetical protein